MTSKNKDAGLLALLDLARANMVRPSHDAMLKSSLSVDAFARYRVLLSSIAETQFNPRYTEAVKKVSVPKEVDAYGAALGRAMNAYDKAKGKRGTLRKRLEKAEAMVRYAQEAIDSNEAVIAKGKQPMWDQFAALSPEAKQWIAPGSGETGWPDKRMEEPPIEQVFPGEMLPWSLALAVVVEELLGER